MTEHDNLSETITPDELQKALKRVADPDYFPAELEVFKQGLEDAGIDSDSILSKVVKPQYEDVKKGNEQWAHSREGKAYIRGALGDGFITRIEDFISTEEEGEDSPTDVKIRESLLQFISDILTKKCEKDELTDDQAEKISSKITKIIMDEPMKSLEDYVTSVVNPFNDLSPSSNESTESEAAEIGSQEASETQEGDFDKLIDTTLIDPEAIEAVLMKEIPSDNTEMTEESRTAKALQLVILELLQTWQETQNESELMRSYFRGVESSSTEEFNGKLDNNIRNFRLMEQDLKASISSLANSGVMDRLRLEQAEAQLVRSNRFVDSIEQGVTAARAQMGQTEILQVQTADDIKLSEQRRRKFAGEEGVDTEEAQNGKDYKLNEHERFVIREFSENLKSLGGQNVEQLVRTQFEKQFNFTNYLQTASYNRANLGNDIRLGLIRIREALHGQQHPAAQQEELSRAIKSTHNLIAGLSSLRM